MRNRSPFLILNNFLSPLECENYVYASDLSFPNTEVDGTPVKTTFKLPLLQRRVWNRIEQYFSSIESYYNVEIDSVSSIDVEWYPEKCLDEPARCENSLYNGRKWAIRNNYDFTVIVFLKTYNEKTDFDVDFECYGGKLEMINHQFSFNPNRGNAIVFPSNQYFINRTTSPILGDFLQLRFHITCTQRFAYDRNMYMGNYSTWFKGLT